MSTTTISVSNLCGDHIGHVVEVGTSRRDEPFVRGVIQEIRTSGEHLFPGTNSDAFRITVDLTLAVNGGARVELGLGGDDQVTLIEFDPAG